MSGSKIRLYGSTSGYVELAAPAVADDGVLTLPTAAAGFGGLVAVKHALKTDTFTSSLGAGSSVDVTGLSITHAVANAANRLIITAFFGVVASSADIARVGIAVYDGSSFLAIGDADGVRSRVGAAGATGAGGTFTAMTPSVTFVHTPGSGSFTYTVRAINVDAGTATVYVNRSEDDPNVVQRQRGASALVIQEVSV